VSGRRGVTLIEMLIVVAIVSLLAGISFPTASAGLDAIRLRSAADALAAFTSDALLQCERRQEVVELLADTRAGTLSALGAASGYRKQFEMPDGVLLSAVLPAPPETGGPHSIVLYPGAPFPALRFELANRRGSRRSVRIDPLTGTPVVEAAP
jgi:prepilin-type N-terminal cleavage/methylation domain-containing protein